MGVQGGMRRDAVEVDVLLQPVPVRRHLEDPGSNDARLVRQSGRRMRLLSTLIALAIISAPLPCEAQQAGRPPRIGVLCSISCQGLAVDAFRRALRELGYVEGRTLVFEYRDAEWKVERLPALAG